MSPREKDSEGCPRIDFDAVARRALAATPWLLPQLLPGGIARGSEYIVRNPRRADRSPGSFRVNINTGRWADFALADVRGGDLISLLAYLDSVNQLEAARRLCVMLGMPV